MVRVKLYVLPDGQVVLVVEVVPPVLLGEADRPAAKRASLGLTIL